MKGEVPFMSEMYVYVWSWSVESVIDVLRGSRMDEGNFRKARINGPDTILGNIT